MSVVLDTVPVSNYEPSESEIIQYGKWLGMNLPEDDCFLWIAKEGLKAPLPEHWKACKSEKGELYYFNFNTGESIWDHPMDEHFKELFKKEKANPGPKSLAAGAQSTPTKKSDKKKKKEKEKKERRHSETGSPDPKETNPSALNTLKFKKELPDELKVNFQSEAPQLFETSKNKAPLLAGTTSPPFSNSTSCASDPEDRMNAAIDPPAGPPPIKLSEPKESSMPKSLGDTLTSDAVETPKNKHRKRKSIAQEVEENRRENDSAAADNSVPREDSVNKETKAQLKNDLQKELASYKASLEEELRDGKKQLEEQYEQLAREEKAKLDREISETLKSLKSELASRKQKDLQKLREKYEVQLNEEKAKIDEEYALKLDTYAREKRQESEKLLDSQRRAASREMETMEDDVKQASLKVVRAYEEAYTTFIRSVVASETDFQEKASENIREIKKRFEDETEQCEREHKKALEREKERMAKELEEVKLNNAKQIEALRSSKEEELAKLRQESQVEKEEATKAHLEEEKEERAKAIQKLREEHQQELEKTKNELKIKAEEELKAVLRDLVKEQKAQQSLSQSDATQNDGSAAEEEEKPFSSEPPPAAAEPGKKRKSEDLPKLDNNLLGQSNDYSNFINQAGSHEDIKAIVTEALKQMFSESPFTMSPTSPGAKYNGASFSGAYGGGEGGAVLPPAVSTISDQRTAMEREYQRVHKARLFVDEQRAALEKRRQQLKRTRHQWKQDVMIAKQEGVRTSSKRGQELNEIRLALEAEAQSLEHDEAALHDSELWLVGKEQRLMQLEQQVEEAEQRGSVGAIDTSGYATGYYKPRQSLAFQSRRLSYPRSSLAFDMAQLEGPTTPTNAPVLSRAISRIEQRLDDVTSMILNNMSPQPSAGPRYSLTQRGSTAQKNVRSRSKVDALHTDPWQ